MLCILCVLCIFIIVAGYPVSGNTYNQEYEVFPFAPFLLFGSNDLQRSNTTLRRDPLRGPRYTA